MLHLLATAAQAVDPKQKAIESVSPNAFFEPTGTLVFLAAAFFVLSAGMIWLIVRAGKGQDYGS